MKTKTFSVVCAVVVLSGCAAGLKPAARTVDDVATQACEQQLFGQAQAQGVSVRDVCRAKAVLQPFIDAILSTGQTVGMKYGTKLPTGE